MARRNLWLHYGISVPFDDDDFSDALIALRVASAIDRHANAASRR